MGDLWVIDNWCVIFDFWKILSINVISERSEAIWVVSQKTFESYC